MSTGLDRAALRRVAAALIPAAGGLPGGADVDHDAVLAADPPLAARAAAALAALPADGGDLDAALAALAVADADGHAALLLAITAAYYADARVRAAIGYGGPAAIPLPALPDARDAGLAPALDRVRERGPRYRATPSS